MNGKKIENDVIGVKRISKRGEAASCLVMTDVGDFVSLELFFL